MRRIVIIAALFVISSCGPLPALDRESIDRLRGGVNPPANEDSGGLRIIVLDVGQGDATLIIAPSGEAMLVDGSPPGAGKDVVLPFLESEGIDELEHIILTHYHEDHMGGIPEVVAGQDGEIGTDDDFMPKGGFYDRGEPQVDPESPVFQVYAASAAGRRHAAHPGDRISVGDVDVEVVAAGGELPDGTQVDLGDPPDENAASIALLIEYNGFRMFIAADITGGGNDPPYETPDVETPLAPFIGDIDVLRVAHHGSQTSTNEAFLAATKPEVAIISVGDGNEYYHPHPSVIERLIESGAAVYQTERGWLDIEGPVVAGGNIVVEVDAGGNFRVDL